MPSTTPFLRLELAAFIAISSGPLLAQGPALTALEQASIASAAPMAPQRLAEFAQGRWHARGALALLGAAGASVPMACDRSPVWPRGFTGSISHVPQDRGTGWPGHLVAVAARAAHCGGLGVDLERTGRLMPEHWHVFLLPRELAWLRSCAAGQRDTLAHGVWSAKEAVMKALRLPLDPQSVDIFISDDSRRFVAQCLLPRPGGAANAVRVEGCLAFEPGWAAAVAMLPPRPSVQA
jgi:4'-phosphopantetheinyl transferase EntD